MNHARFTSASLLSLCLGWSGMGAGSAWSHGGSHSDSGTPDGGTVIDGMEELPVFKPSSARPTRGAYEVWLSDQANTNGISSTNPNGTMAAWSGFTTRPIWS